MQTTIERPTIELPNIWMPIYWGDYLKETSHLDALRHGAYLLLICHYWCSGKPLPNDDTVLARIARLSPAMWRKLRPVISAFFEIDGNGWRHRHTDKLFEEATLRKTKAVESARNAANKRWAKPDAPGMPEAMPSQCPSSSSSPSEELPPDGVVPPESPRALDGGPRPLGEIILNLIARKRRDP